MTPEERLAHLLDEDRWNGPGFVGRTTARRRAGPARTVLVAIAAGLVVGVTLTVAISSFRGSTTVSNPADPLLPAVSASPTPTPPAHGYTWVEGVDPAVGTRVQGAATKNGRPLAYWGADRATLSIVTWGGMCDSQIPGPIDFTDVRVLAVSFGPDPTISEGNRGCIGGVSAVTTTFPVPAGVPATGVVTIAVTSQQSGTPTTVTILDPDQLANAPAPGCVVSQLSARVSESGAGMGTLYQDLVITNTSSHSCSLEGLPMVDFERSGVVVGATAKNDYWVQKPSLVHLRAHGGFAAVRLELANAVDYESGDCAAVTSSGIRVSIPDSSGSLIALWHAQVCTVAGANQFSASDFLAKRSVKVTGWQK